MGVPYNSLNNQVKQFPPEWKNKILRGRFTWELQEKLAIVKEAEKRGYSTVAKENSIDRSQLSHWRKELQEAKLLPVKPLRRGRPPTKKRAKKAS